MVTVTSGLDRGTPGGTSVTLPACGPLWLRLAEYAVDHERGGVVLLDAGELRRALGASSSSEVTRAIRRAIAAGWLTPRSNTRTLLVVPAKRRARASAR